MAKRLVAVLAIALLPLGRAGAQDTAPVELQRIDGPIKLDGLSDEPAWATVPPFHLVQYEPNPGDQPTERSEIRVTYDSDFMYFSLRAYDSDRAGIRANSLYRDRLSGDDHFEILLDTFNDNETAVLFTTTPSGMRKDATISNDATGGTLASGSWLNNDYNTYWDVATIVTEEGWFAEIRVPFSSLRFQTVDETVTMGLALQRKIARKAERVVYPPVRPIAQWAFLKPSLARKIILRGVYPRRPLYITPYVLAGLGRSNDLNDAGSRYVGDTNNQLEVGGDLKYGLSDNTTLDLTVNMDFAQVEADDEQVNLTRFSLFFPEKRQFFQERAGIFDFRTGGQSRLFHSRRMGLTDDGETVRILGGARLVGRIGNWDVGILDLQSAAHSGLASENFGLVRVRRRVLNDYSFAGAMATSRVGDDGRYNFAYGVDGVLRLFGDDYLTAKWAQTFDEQRIDDVGFEPFDSGRMVLELQRRLLEGFGYSTSVVWSGRDYDPGLGFTQRTDFTQLDEEVSYGWLPAATSSLLWHRLSLEGLAILRNRDRAVESAEVGPEWEFGKRTNVSGSIEAKLIYEDLQEPFLLPEGVVVPANSYTFYRLGGSYRRPHSDLLQFQSEANIGTFYDGWQATATVTPIWYASPHLELRATYLYSHVWFSERGQGFDAHVARLRIGTALDTRMSAIAFVQYNSTADVLSANVRLRFNIREGNDLWIVYNEGVNTDIVGMLPRIPRSDSRAFLIKYTHTLVR